MKPATGRPRRTSAPASMKAMRCRRSISPRRSRIRPSWCSRRRWRRSPLPAPLTGHCCRRGSSHPASCPTRSSKAWSMPAKHMRRISPATYTVDETYRPGFGRTGRREGCCSLPPRLVSRRRHRRRQGPPGRRDHSRQLAQGPPQGGLDLEIRQADRGCRARLDGGRRLPLRHRPAVTLPPGCGDRARRGHPLHHLRDAAHAGARATRSAASSRSSTGSAGGIRRRHRLRRGARHGQCRRRQVRARRKETVAAGPGRIAPAARAARRARSLRLGDRCHDGAEPRLCRPARPLGHR